VRWAAPEPVEATEVAGRAPSGGGQESGELTAGGRRLDGANGLGWAVFKECGLVAWPI
jgi:hypothetical protein